MLSQKGGNTYPNLTEYIFILRNKRKKKHFKQNNTDHLTISTTMKVQPWNGHCVRGGGGGGKWGRFS